MTSTNPITRPAAKQMRLIAEMESARGQLYPPARRIFGPKASLMATTCLQSPAAVCAERQLDDRT